MKQIDIETKKAITSLRSNPSFAVFVKWLKDSETQEDEDIYKIADEVKMRWAQGRLGILREMIKNVTVIMSQ